MEIVEYSVLLFEDVVSVIMFVVVVFQDYGYGEGKLCDLVCQMQIFISKIINEKNSVGFELLQQLFICVVLGVMEIIGNGKLQVFQSECLGCGYFVLNWF